MPIKFLVYPFDALGPRRAPTFWPAESRQRLAEGLRPYRYPLAVALECLRHNRARGVTELLAAYAAGASGRFAKALPQKPFRTLSHALTRMIGELFLTGNVGGQGAQPPNVHDRQTSPNGERGGARGRSPPNVHDRQMFPNGERGGQGGVSPQSEAVEVRQPWRARTRSRFPQRHRSSSREAARSSANPDSGARLGGFQRGASSTPLWSGDPQGGETPLRLSLPTFCRSRK